MVQQGSSNWVSQYGRRSPQWWTESAKDENWKKFSEEDTVLRFSKMPISHSFNYKGNHVSGTGFHSMVPG